MSIPAKRNISYRVALGGIVSAFSLMCMFLTGVFPLLYLVLAMLSGELLLIVVMEVSTQWGWLTYLAVSLLSVFVTFDKEAALIFILFFGSYPLLHGLLGHIRWRIVRLPLKLLLFNVCMLLYYYITVYVLGLAELMESLEEYGRYAGAVILLLLNPFFLLYDYTLDGLCNLYRLRLKPRITGRHL